MSSSAYNERQSRRDDEYAAGYAKWLASLSPAERKRAERMGLAQADDGRTIAHKVEAFDEENAHEILTTTPEQTTEFNRALAESMSELFHWMVMPPGQRGLNAKAVGCRVIMAMWVMRPDIIGNLSLTEISALVDARPEVLCRQARAFSKRFGIRGRAQFSDKTRDAQRAAAKRRNGSVESDTLPELPLFPADPSLN